ncbi:type II toxin-antitoxin system MqsA family antitoxin [Altererythrobacter sp. KTW20L]|uniref:type II TA system antitoxin MqsA family protein n=1 Tax=Altererythrobacter sp. KTW20L TaxID=2942210 RepID=UPI0020BDA026|nr:type II toxin-antitoxin system MqsA family antitoxin [Altererythrobacter sp. KTW20L]
MTQTRIHPETGQVLRRAARVQTVSVGSMSREVEVSGWYPEDGGDSIHSGAELQALDRAYLELRAAYAARVKAVRKKLGLTQEEAGRIIGGGRRAFQKYESGATPPSDAAVGLIEILDRHPEELETLRNLRRLASREGAGGRLTPTGKKGTATKGVRSVAA